MAKVDWPLGFGGLRGDEVTTAEVLSQAGYATAFYSKWHLGDIEESYPHNQGFDEAFFSPYNQVAGIWNAQGDAVNASLGVDPEMRPAYPYEMDTVGLHPDGWIQTIEGKKGEQGREWGERTYDPYKSIDLESEKRLLEFVRRNAENKQPFFVTYWPLMIGLLPEAKKTTLQGGLVADSLKRLDGFIGQLMAELERLGIAENTLIVAMADNGPMVHNPPPGMGLAETIFRGGKGDFTEGGVRVPAFAWWPGTIKPGQIVNDIVHETDLLMTFARLAGATPYVPDDRVIDGLDQTALLLNGDKHGRRDYVFIYAGETLGATVKGRYERHWVAGEGAGTGTAAAFYDLILDPREASPLLVPLIWTSSQFERMRARHELWMRRYPNKPKGRGIPFTGISNARPETRAIAEKIEELRQRLPFDPLEYLELKLAEVPGKVNVVD
jgi:arylsulfatase A-like enzyme